jgi:hypothetical protein
MSGSPRAPAAPVPAIVALPICDLAPVTRTMWPFSVGGRDVRHGGRQWVAIRSATS